LQKPLPDGNKTTESDADMARLKKTILVAAFAAAAFLCAMPFDSLAQAAPTPQPAPDDTVYVTANGKRYHRKECRYAKTATAMTRKEAEAKGLTPCKVCKP
jgi:hypothetical protein